MILKFICIFKGSGLEENRFEKEEQIWRIYTTQFQNFSSQHSVVLV